MANNTNGHDGSGEFCFMCRRSEEQAGKMVYLPGGLKICQDCMQKTMDMASKMDLQSLLSNPMFMQGNPFFQGTMPSQPGNDKETEDKNIEEENTKRSVEPVSADLSEDEGEPDEPEIEDRPEDEDEGT